MVYHLDYFITYSCYRIAFNLKSVVFVPSSVAILMSIYSPAHSLDCSICVYQQGWTGSMRMFFIHVMRPCSSRCSRFLPKGKEGRLNIRKNPNSTFCKIALTHAQQPDNSPGKGTSGQPIETKNRNQFTRLSLLAAAVVAFV